MPVNIIYCEGGKNSPDSRILLNLVSGMGITIKYARSKYGIDRQILFIMQENLLPGSAVAALKDRDFDDDDSSPENAPRDWSVRDNEQNIRIGWSWERKEIENYLIDPDVVSRALGSKAPPPDDYRSSLENSAKTIADYTAARTALSLPRQTRLPLKNCWGTQGINSRHLFPELLSISDCCEGIKNNVRLYEQTQIIREDDVLSSFNKLLLSCRSGGTRFQYFLTFFSGKDLLYGMRTDIRKFGLGKPCDFLERIVKGIENSTDNVWMWLSEWERLRQLLKA